ncbi:hypothetical protein DFS34DRAFT_590436 [Phlyctochytrium arcticum]|nr:hypothetical protein DFS34DRAFT_590436 [Phlyctochytrium arcticum]
MKLVIRTTSYHKPTANTMPSKACEADNVSLYHGIVEKSETGSCKNCDSDKDSDGNGNREVQRGQWHYFEDILETEYLPVGYYEFQDALQKWLEFRKSDDWDGDLYSPYYILEHSSDATITNTPMVLGWNGVCYE